MKAVIQRVATAWVDIDGKRIATIEKGILILLGVEKDDRENDAFWLAEKIGNLRIFEDDAGKMNLSVQEVQGQILAVSQFTLAGNCVKGRRPSFDGAAPPDYAVIMYERFVAKMKELNIDVKTGIFQNNMQVGLVNDGPVTFILESPKRNAV